MDLLNRLGFIMPFSTPDLSDNFPIANAIDLQFRTFGGKAVFEGPALTIQCYEDNSFVKDLAQQEGNGRIMVVDGGGSLRKALLGDKLASTAASKGWAGFVIVGAVRDVEILRDINLGILALGVSPIKTEKKGVGMKDLTLKIGGVSVDSGCHIYADLNGVIVSRSDLLNQNK